MKMYVTISVAIRDAIYFYLFIYLFFGVPHLATFIFINFQLDYNWMYTVPGLEPTTTQLWVLSLNH